jgi:nicotinamidase-related amidase
MFPQTTALLLVDVQKAWDDPYWGQRNNPDAESNLAALAQAFRRHGLTVLHSQYDAPDPHSPLHPGEPGHGFKAGTAPLDGEAVFHKTGHSAFHGTGLEDHLRLQGIDRLVIAGFTTSHSVSSTARAASDRGFKTAVVRDACAAFDLDSLDGDPIPAQSLHDVGLAELQGEFATVLSAQALLQLL